MYHPQKILSENTKTNISLNLPIPGHCQPTKTCMACCYAKVGPINWSLALKKRNWLSNYLKGKDIQDLVRECLPYSSVRLSGTGDLLPEHCKNVIKLAESCPGTQFWGMTRKLEIANAINNKVKNLRLLVTVDATSPARTWDYNGKLCFGPRRVGDVVPNDKRIITVFPYHFIGKVVGKVPKHEKDCPAVWHKVKGCIECGRCWRY